MVNTARQNLKSALIGATENRQEREAIALEPKQNVIRGRVGSVGKSGVTLRTENNGEITIPRRPGDAQGYTPTAGEIVQVSTSGGVAKIISNSQDQGQQQTAVGRPPFAIISRTPTTGDIGHPAVPFSIKFTGEVDDTSNLPTAELYAWTGSLPTYVQIGGGGGGGVAFSGVKLRTSTAQSITEGTQFTFDWDTTGGAKDWDTDNYHSATNSDRVTIPSAGKYEITFFAFLNLNNSDADARTDWRVYMIHKDSGGSIQNGTGGSSWDWVTVSRANGPTPFPSSTLGVAATHATWQIEASEGDYIEVDGLVFSSGATSVTTDATGIGFGHSKTLTVKRLDT